MARARLSTASRLEPQWTFTAVDPSQPMMDLAVQRLQEHGLLGQTKVVRAALEDTPITDQFDAATLIGVLHHLPGEAAKKRLLADLAARLKPGAPLILAGNYHAYASQPLLLKAWSERWRLHGAGPDEIEAKLGKILQGADPPSSEQVVFDLLHEAGFDAPLRFFCSGFWGAWVAHRRT